MREQHKTDTLIDTLLAIGQFLLILMGLIGISVQIFGDQGVLNRLLTKLMAIESLTAVVALPFLFVIFVVFKSWFVKTKGDEATSAYGNFLMYVMMAVGAFFIFRYLTTGSLVI